MSVIINKDGELQTVTLEVGQFVMMTEAGLVIDEKPLTKLKNMMDKTFLKQLIPLLKNCKHMSVEDNKRNYTRIIVADHIFEFPITFDPSFTKQSVYDLYPKYKITGEYTSVDSWHQYDGYKYYNW
jgi:hypothetical protein